MMYPNITIESSSSAEETNGLKFPVLLHKVLLDSVEILITIKTYTSANPYTFAPQRQVVINYNIENIQDARIKYGKDLTLRLHEALYNILFGSIENGASSL